MKGQDISIFFFKKTSFFLLLFLFLFSFSPLFLQTKKMNELHRLMFN